MPTPKPSSARRRGAKLERKVAQQMGGRRTPLSGAVGGGDITVPSDSCWADWSIECKLRRRPSWTDVRRALEQADTRTGKCPLAVIGQVGGDTYAVCRLSDLVGWVDALMGAGLRGAELRAKVHELRRLLDELEEVVKR